MTETSLSAPTLRVDGVCKTFSGHKAVDDVSFSLNAGERVAMLGHNGAGKTTLFKIVLGFLKRDHGDVAVMGAAPAVTMPVSARPICRNQSPFPPRSPARKC